MRLFLKILAYLAAGAGVMAFFSMTAPPRDNAVLSAYFDSGHVIIFGLLAWVGLGIWNATTHKDRKWEGYAVVFLGVTALGALTEALQIIGPRRAEVLDIVRNIAGIAAFLLLAFGWEKGASFKRKACVIGLAGVIFLAAFLPALTLSGAFLWRNQSLPNLVDYGSLWAKPLWGVGEATASIETPPPGFEGEFKKVAKVTFLEGTYPRLTLGYPSPDWSPYEALVFEVYSELDSVRVLYLRIHDQKHREEVSDRFNYSFPVNSGINRIRIPLKAIQQGPVTRLMDMRHIDGLALFTIRPPRSFELYFSPFRLE